MPNIGEIRLKIAELQKLDKKIEKLKAIVKLKESWKDIDEMLY